MGVPRCPVFPTPVGVFLPCRLRHHPRWGLPHTRGGVSSVQHRQNSVPRSSPHPWGCFWSYCSGCPCVPVFPTPVGVFLGILRSSGGEIGLPHTRGGVSYIPGSNPDGKVSSPHPWGCFFRYQTQLQSRHVFPTPVGVFLKAGNTLIDTRGLPHTRGGVSFYHSWEWLRLRSSPHPWGCFLGGAVWAGLALVFPTPVGVFPELLPASLYPRRLPHTRGGVSLL